MFKIEPEQRVDWPVQLHRPRAGGGHDKVTFTVTFAVLKRREMLELQKQLARAEEDAEALDLIARLVVGWPDGAIADAGGTPIPYGRAALGALIDEPGVWPAILAAWGEMMAPPARESRRLGN